MGIKVKHLLLCVSPQEGWGRVENAGIFYRRNPDPGASLLLHDPREDNQKAEMLPLDLGDVQNS